MDRRFSSGDQRHPSEMAVKPEPVDERMTGSSADMSVDAASLTPDFRHLGLATHVSYLPFPMDERAAPYYPAMYTNSQYGMRPQGALTQHFPNAQRHPLQADLRPSASQPLPQSHLQHQQSQQHSHHHQQQQQQMTPSHSSRTPHPDSPNGSQLSPEMSGFKMKDSKGKLAMLDMLGAAQGNNAESLDFALNSHQRAKREFVPDNKKDDCYWNKRLKNNDSARRSRVKRKQLEKMMESRLCDLQKENIELRHEMAALRRQYGVPETAASLAQGAASTAASQEFSREFAALSSSQEEELEQQSAGSDDSHGIDDSRTYNVGSMSALSHSLGPAVRDRADSFGSGSSSGSGGSGSRPDSRSSQPGNADYSVRTDKSGALDLSSSDNSNRSTPAREARSPESESYSTKCLKSDSISDPDSPDTDCEERRKGHEYRQVPLKCRFKRSMHSGIQTSPTTARSPPNMD